MLLGRVGCRSSISREWAGLGNEPGQILARVLMKGVSLKQPFVPLLTRERERERARRSAAALPFRLRLRRRGARSSSLSSWLQTRIAGNKNLGSFLINV
ncbi:hypothetical protein OPV22_017070 [Ensete ventricosum]|uniref:Uncharacterized protein n=1 Tax=Ensete ventricosum TaxID=4639 RepID=A0AAV8PEW6_ENSVE|nr:hypothetical protein OPV22_017070 [Ensete ventricosum]